MPFNSTASLFQVLPDDLVPALLGGTGKRAIETTDFYRWETSSPDLKYSLAVSELQSLITFMAGNIAELENQKTWAKESIAVYYRLMVEIPGEEVNNWAKEQLEEYIVLRNTADKKLKQLRKIQTKLKRQRANCY